MYTKFTTLIHTIQVNVYPKQIIYSNLNYFFFFFCNWQLYLLFTESTHTKAQKVVYFFPVFVSFKFLFSCPFITFSFSSSSSYLIESLINVTLCIEPLASNEPRRLVYVIGFILLNWPHYYLLLSDDFFLLESDFGFRQARLSFFHQCVNPFPQYCHRTQSVQTIICCLFCFVFYFLVCVPFLLRNFIHNSSKFGDVLLGDLMCLIYFWCWAKNEMLSEP